VSYKEAVMRNLCVLYLFHTLEGVYEKFKRTGECQYIRSLCRIEYTWESYFGKTEPSKDKLEKLQCVCKIPCECGRDYIGETGRLLCVRVREHKHNLK
jgi:hypothetical protein